MTGSTDHAMLIEEPDEPLTLSSWQAHRLALDAMPADHPDVAGAKDHADMMIALLATPSADAEDAADAP